MEKIASKGGIVNESLEDLSAEKLAEEMHTKTPSIKQHQTKLKGGITCIM
ncbi:MAG: hypothetical protein II044_07380 [Lachnospiraceae bacterium]|jgi:hypothetical protein|nr:hypothetical protein [Lachnospiraceae bacterium]